MSQPNCFEVVCLFVIVGGGCGVVVVVVIVVFVVLDANIVV